MPKLNVIIPKGTVCKDGQICSQDINVDIDAPEPPAPKATPIPTPKIELPEPAMPEHNHSHEEKPKLSLTHDQMSELMPSSVNFAKCKDGNCGLGLIKNSKITKEFKTCNHCGANSVPKKNEFCPTCGVKESDIVEDQREDLWGESEIDTEKIEDAEG